MILFLFSFSGCADKRASENPQQDVIGKWESADKSLLLEFKHDKKLSSVNMIRGGVKVESTGDVIFFDNSHIYSTWHTNSEVYEISVYPDHIILKSPKGQIEKLKRIN